MPTYEYECPEGHEFEKFQKMTDKPRAKCPTCGKTATRKISGGAGLVFKGSGFYITDYGKDGKGPRKAESEKPAAEPKADAGQAGRHARPPSATPRPTPSRRSQARRKGRPPPSERRASRRARAGGLATRRRRRGVRARAAPRRGPRRSRDQPGHGARQARARQSRGRWPSASSRSCSSRARWSRGPRSPAPASSTSGSPRTSSPPPHRAHPRRRARRTAGATAGAGLDVNVEFVSANPTGPLHVGHGRGAALGDAIAALLEWTGHARHPRVLHQRRRRADRPAGAEPLGARAASSAATRPRFPRAATTASTSRRTRARCSSAKGRASPSCRRRRACAAAAPSRSGMQREEQDRDLADFGVRFDVMTSEQALYDRGRVERALRPARASADLTFEADGALWLRTTEFGDDKDRVLRKSDGELHLLRARHRLPHRQARARLRPRHRRLGRGPPRLHPADAGRARRRSATRRSSSTWRWCSW